MSDTKENTIVIPEGMSPETYLEMLNAFGEGTTVVNVITGDKIEL